MKNIKVRTLQWMRKIISPVSLEMRFILIAILFTVVVFLIHYPLLQDLKEWIIYKLSQ